MGDQALICFFARRTGLLHKYINQSPAPVGRAIARRAQELDMLPKDRPTASVQSVSIDADQYFRARLSRARVDSTRFSAPNR